MTIELQAPSKKLRVGDTELVMSYGMKTEIFRIIGGNVLDNLEMLFVDTLLRDLVIRRLFTTSPKPIESDADLIPGFEIDIDDDQVHAIIMWVMDHAMYFFAKGPATPQALANKYQEVGKSARSAQSKSGSKG